MANPTDRVRIAWALVDGVRGVPPPPQYESDVGGVPVSQLVFELSDATRLSAWWSKHSVRLQGRAMGDNDDTLAAFKTGKQMTFDITNDGKVDPRLLAVVLAAALSPDRVAECMSRPPAPAISSRQASNWRCLEGVTLVKLGQHHVRIYFSFVFAKELTKLLSNQNWCLKDHFNGVELQMRVARGHDAVWGPTPRVAWWAGGRSSKRTRGAGPWRWRIGATTWLPTAASLRCTSAMFAPSEAR